MFTISRRPIVTKSMISSSKPILTVVLLLTSVLPAFTQAPAESAASPKYIVSEAAARKIVESVLKTSPVIDGHNDLLVHYFDCKTCPRGPRQIKDKI